MHRVLASLVVVALVLAFGLPAQADGNFFVRTVSADADVRARAQRAVLVWRGSHAWDIHIQPVFDRASGAGAWVVPFPVRPEVAESDPGLFDELEFLTTPVFERVCEIRGDSGGSCLSGGSGAADEATTIDATSEVTVWQRGAVGALDYVVLSSANGESLTEWLAAEGFILTERARAAVESLDTSDGYLFVARVSDGADPTTPLAPVRFRLLGLSGPWYPMELTATAVPDGAFLELTLWLATPEGDVWAPESHGYQEVGREVRNRQEYGARLDAILGPSGGDQLVLSAYVMPVQFPHAAAYSSRGMEVPEGWSDELTRMVEGDFRLWRYDARLSGNGLHDIVFGMIPAGALVPMQDMVYREYLSGEVCDEALQKSGTSSPAGAFSVVLLALIGAALRAGWRSVRREGHATKQSAP